MQPHKKHTLALSRKMHAGTFMGISHYCRAQKTHGVFEGALVVSRRARSKKAKKNSCKGLAVAPDSMRGHMLLDWPTYPCNLN